MRLGIDYDDTWTLDPTFWCGVVDLARSRGHEMVIITNRGPSRPEWPVITEQLPVPVIYANGRPKAEAARMAGLTVDIWIEDMPWRVNFGWQNPICVQMGLE